MRWWIWPLSGNPFNFRVFMTSQRLCDELMTLWCLTKIFGSDWETLTWTQSKARFGNKGRNKPSDKPSDEDEGETVLQPLWNFACVQLISTQKKHIWDSICWTVGFSKCCSSSLIPDSHWRICSVWQLWPLSTLYLVTCSWQAETPWWCHLDAQSMSFFFSESRTDSSKPSITDDTWIQAAASCCRVFLYYKKKEKQLTGWSERGRV